MDTNTSEVDWNVTEDIRSSIHADAPPRYGPFEHHITNADNIYFYSLGIVIPFGLIGNVFTVCVFLLSPILRHTTTGQYLVALAIADSTVLVGELLRWFSYHTEIQPEYYFAKSLRVFDSSLAACMITFFLRYGGGLWSVWLTIAIALERLLAVAFPLRISYISTPRRSRIVILVIAIISFSLASFTFWEFRIKRNQCRIISKNRYDIWNTVILKFGTLIIPGVLIAILTVIIIVLLYRARNKGTFQLGTPALGNRTEASNSLFLPENQLTLMLVTVCIATTALRGPYTIAYYFRTQCWTWCSLLTDVQTYVAYRITEIFSVINYAINFILYCLSGRLFREQIKKTVCRGSKTGSTSDAQEISLETPTMPQPESNICQLRVTPKGSPSLDRTTDSV